MYVSKHRSHIRASRRCWIRKRFTDSLTDIYMKNKKYIFFKFLHPYKIATTICNPETYAVKQILAMEFFVLVHWT
jgi:hypothetical protein